MRITAKALGLLVTVLPAQGWALGPATITAEGEQEIVAYVTNEMDSLASPGAAVAIVQGGDLVLARGFGITGTDGDAVTAATPFHIASVSKSLTGLGVMQLVESGRLNLDDSLGQLLPALVPAASGAGAITVADLLGHTSGWTEGNGLANRIDPDLTDQALALNVARIIDTPLSHPIGEFEYSNANYDVLGYLIEQISGEPYGEYMQAHVFEPLRMTHSYTSAEAATAGGVADGHYPFFGIVRPHPMVYVPGSVPSSYISASAEDLGHFLIANLNGGRYGDAALLSPEGMDRFQTPLARPNPWDGYAMGLWVYPLWNAGQLVTGSIPEYRVPVILEHGGDSESYASSILLLPEENLGVVVLLNINDESTPSVYHQMHIGIASILLGHEPAPTVPYEGTVERYAKWIAVAVIALFLVRVALSFRRVRLNSGGGVLRKAVGPLALDLIFVAAVWWLLVDQAAAPLTLIRRSVPDIFAATLLASLVLLGWTVTRTMVVVRRR